MQSTPTGPRIVINVCVPLSSSPGYYYFFLSFLPYIITVHNNIYDFIIDINCILIYISRISNAIRPSVGPRPAGSVLMTLVRSPSFPRCSRSFHRHPPPPVRPFLSYIIVHKCPFGFVIVVIHTCMYTHTHTHTYISTFLRRFPVYRLVRTMRPRRRPVAMLI